MDWHPDSKAQNFYPKKGRVGKKFVGKPGRSELIHEKHGRHVKRLLRAYWNKYEDYPSRDYVDQLIRDGSIWQEIRRLEFKQVKVVKETGRYTEVIKSLQSYLEKARAAKGANEEEDSIPEPSPEVLEKREKSRIRSNSPVPFKIMHKLKRGQVDEKKIMSAFDIDSETMKRLKWAWEIS